MRRIYIIAGNADQARNLAFRLNYTSQAYTYLSSVEQLRGLNNVTVIVYGEWYKKFNENDLRLLARTRGFHFLSIGEFSV